MAEAFCVPLILDDWTPWKHSTILWKPSADTWKNKIRVL